MRRSKAIDMESPIALNVKEMISSNSVVIFSKTYCPYCKLAKEAFDKLHQSYTAIELDQRVDGEDIQRVLGQITGAQTVPRVFVKGECLGGGMEIKRMYEDGKLMKYFQ